MKRTWPLVGRSEELRLIADSLESGESGGVVLAGPAGCGKTRLATEALAAARERGFATEWAVASAAASAIPFAPFSHMLPGDMSADAAGLDMLRLATRALSDKRGTRGIVLGVDDAHLLDKASAALLQQVASTRTAFVVATLRSSEPAHDPVVALWKDELAERIELQNLSRDEVRELVERAVEGRVDGGTLHHLWTSSRGNPLFLRELVLGALDSGALKAVDGVWKWSGDVSSRRLVELIEARLSGIDAVGRDALELLAFGEPIALPLAASLVGERTLETLERHGLLSVSADARRSLVVLAHPLYGEVLRASVPPLRAGAIKHGLADAFDAAAEDPLRIATWRLESGEPAAPDLLVQAAERATAMLDHALADRLARAAIDAGGGFAATVVLANSLNWQARYAEAEALLSGLEPSTDRERARLASVWSNSIFWSSGDLDRAVEVSEGAEPSVKDPDLIDYIRAHRSGMLLFGGRSSDAVAVARSILDREGASEANVRAALATAVPGLALLGRGSEALDVLRPYERALMGQTEMNLRYTGWIFAGRILASWFTGDLGEAEIVAGLLYQASLANPGDGIRGGSALACGRVALYRGRPRSAIAWLQEGASSLRRYDLGGLLPWCLGSLAHAYALAGETEAAARTMDEADAAASPAFGMFEADVELAHAWTVRSPAYAIGAADRAAAMGQRPFELIALHDALRLGSLEVVDRLREAGAGLDGKLAAAIVAHAEAVVARDAAALDTASIAFESMGLQLLAAEASALASEVHTDGGRAASARAAAQRASALASSCEGAVTPALVALWRPPALTAREHEIAQLAADGLSSREIADRLVVSVRTVDNHLHQVYIKLGVSRRSQLADAIRRG